MAAVLSVNAGAVAVHATRPLLTLHPLAIAAATIAVQLLIIVVFALVASRRHVSPEGECEAACPRELHDVLIGSSTLVSFRLARANVRYFFTRLACDVGATIQLIMHTIVDVSTCAKSINASTRSNSIVRFRGRSIAIQIMQLRTFY